MHEYVWLENKEETLGAVMHMCQRVIMSLFLSMHAQRCSQCVHMRICTGVGGHRQRTWMYEKQYQNNN